MTLARMHGIQTSYSDVFGRRHTATPESILQALKALAIELRTQEDAAEVLRRSRLEQWRTATEPVTVAWSGQASSFTLRTPVDLSPRRIQCRLTLEEGEAVQWDVNLSRVKVERSTLSEGTRFELRSIGLPANLPHGYHSLAVEGMARRSESLVISAPQRAHASGNGLWGLFVPLYALRSDRDWGCGDFSDMAQLLEWVSGLGGAVAGSVPMLAAYLDEPYDPSPYAPASRLFWNECYVDPEQAEEFRECAPARQLSESQDLRREIREMRADALVDYRRLMRVKQRVLEEMARWVGRQPVWREKLANFCRSRAYLEDYAAFRAVLDSRRTPWSQWPAPQSSGFIRLGDYDEDRRLYYLYTQWLAERQLSLVSSKARAAGGGLYMDFPLGVHPHSYDVWRHRETFARGACGGAPPDSVFTKGQNWGFPPLHPEAARREGYRYFIACVRHLMQHAGILRIDHVMGLHRLFWVPDGMEARDGVYVRYRAEELYAVAVVESHRWGAAVVGENLGTVPPAVNRALERHGFGQTYIVQYEAKPDGPRPLRPVPPGSVASLNTHDMPPFSGYLRGLDFQDRMDLGLMSKKELRAEEKTRERTRRALARYLHVTGTDGRRLTEACLKWLAASPAAVLLVNLENLWMETQPQNLPGTGQERPNWRRKLRFTLEEFRVDLRVVALLGELSEIRGRHELERKENAR